MDLISYDLYVGILNPRDGKHTPMLRDSFDTLPAAKRAARKITGAPWRIVEAKYRVMATSDTVPADA